MHMRGCGCNAHWACAYVYEGTYNLRHKAVVMVVVAAVGEAPLLWSTVISVPGCGRQNNSSQGVDGTVSQPRCLVAMQPIP
ncbi:hypothetical protein Hamer_G016570 [Homarus americanus]|uniref:Uncharacterized protein n=1 Tax=Homarus americanus TaxID=6706 RepID=A0A8J5JKM4_HOMAM|nr:hypothetical protein Hamer_G016570 [Homarus americanus]